MFDNILLVKVWGKRRTYAWLLSEWIGANLLEAVWQYLSKFKRSIPVTLIFSSGNLCVSLQAHKPVWSMCQIIHCSTVIGKDWRQSKSINRWLVKWMMHPHSLYLGKERSPRYTVGWKKPRENSIYSMLLFT